MKTNRISSSLFVILIISALLLSAYPVMTVSAQSGSAVLYEGDARSFSDPPDVFAYGNIDHVSPPAEFDITTGGSIWRYYQWIALMDSSGWVEATTTVPATSVGLQFWGDGNDGWATVYVDGVESWSGNTKGSDNQYPGGAFVKYLQISGLSNTTHTIRVESTYGEDVTIYFFGLGDASNSPGSSGPVPQSGLVAHYTFDGNTNDQSGNGNHATNNGGTYTTGVSGQCINLDGQDDHVSVPVNINPDVMPQLTITAWARANNATGTLISHDNGGYDRTIDIDSRGGGLGWSSFAGSGGVLGYYPVTTGEWVFVAAVWDQIDGTVKLYVNNSEYEKEGSLSSGLDYFNIGSNPSFGSHFPGMVDEVRVYTSALSRSEIDSIRTSTQVQASGPPSSGKSLVVYYPFDGDYRDHSENTNDGTPKGNMVFTTGKIGQAAKFDGQSWIEVNDSSSLDLYNEFTISLWLYKEDAGAGGWTVIVSKGDTAAVNDNSPYALAHTQDGRYPLVRLTKDNSYQMVSSSTMGDFKEWHQVTVTWDGSTVRFYLDGEYQDSADWEGTLPNSSAKLLIGCDPPGSTEYFRGFMDDLRIYNYALTQSEISDLSDSTTAPDTTPPPETTSPPDGIDCEIVGTWQWINGDTVYVHNNGTMESLRGITGTWRSIGNGVYELEWNNGYTDTLTISSDCNSLSGHNQYGGSVSATRTSDDDAGPGEPEIPVPEPTDRPDSTFTPDETSTPAPAETTEPAPGDPATLTFESRSKATGSSIQIPLTLSGMTDIAGNMDLTLNYDSSVLRATEAIKGSLTSNSLFDYNIQNGTILISLADSAGFTGNGSVAYIRFDVIGSEGSASPLTISDLTANKAGDLSLLNIRTVDGLFTVLSIEETIADCDGDGTVSVVDALCALQMAVGKKAEELSMDINNDGKVTSIDARQILQMAVTSGRIDTAYDGEFAGLVTELESCENCVGEGIEVFDTNRDGTDDKWRYSLVETEVEEGLFAQEVFQLEQETAGIQGTMIVTLENRGDRDYFDYEYLIEIPKSFAETVDDMGLPDSFEVIDPDPAGKGKADCLKGSKVSWNFKKNDWVHNYDQFIKDAVLSQATKQGNYRDRVKYVLQMALKHEKPDYCDLIDKELLGDVLSDTEVQQLKTYIQIQAKPRIKKYIEEKRSGKIATAAGGTGGSGGASGGTGSTGTGSTTTSSGTSDRELGDYGMECLPGDVCNEGECQNGICIHCGNWGERCCYAEDLEGKCTDFGYDPPASCNGGYCYHKSDDCGHVGYKACDQNGKKVCYDGVVDPASSGTLTLCIACGDYEQPCCQYTDYPCNYGECMTKDGKNKVGYPHIGGICKDTTASGTPAATGTGGVSSSTGGSCGGCGGTCCAGPDPCRATKTKDGTPSLKRECVDGTCQVTNATANEWCSEVAKRAQEESPTGGKIKSVKAIIVDDCGARCVMDWW